MKKKILLPLIFCAFFGLNSQLYSQNKAQSNTEHITELINKSEINKIYLVATNMHREYSKEWLDNISISEETITFTKGDKSHRWNIKHTVFIEKYGDIIKIRMNEMIGE